MHKPYRVVLLYVLLLLAMFLVAPLVCAGIGMLLKFG